MICMDAGLLPGGSNDFVGIGIKKLTMRILDMFNFFNSLATNRSAFS